MLPRVAGGFPPTMGKRALVGGRLHVGVDEDETPVAAARRIAGEKVGLDVRYLEQLYTFGGQHRETVWTVTIAYLALLGEDGVPERLHPDLHPVADLPKLAFDHNIIARKAVERLRNGAAYSSLPAYLLPPEFTIDELRRLYEQVMEEPLNKSVFREQIVRQGFIEMTGRQEEGVKHRPAQLWRLSGPDLVNFDTQLANQERENARRRGGTP